MERTLKPTLQLSAGRAAAFVVTFLTPLVLVRLFDATDFGTYKQIFLVYSTVWIIGQIGMAESLFYFVPRTPARSAALVANSAVVLAACGVLAAIALTLGAERIGGWLGNPRLAQYMPWLAAFVLLSMISAGLEIVLVASKRHLAAATSYFTSETVKAVLLLAPALWLGSLQWLMAGAVGFAALRAVAAAGVYRTVLPGRLRPDFRLLREQFAYAAPFAAAVTVEILQVNWHHYVVASRFTPAVFAIYAVGCLQVPLIDFVASPACNVMMVGMREALERGQRSEALRLWRETTHRVALLVVPIVCGLLVVAPELIVVLFTDAYRASVPIFVLWTLTPIFAVLQTDGVLRAWADTRLLLGLSVLRLLFIAAAIDPLLDRFGLRGAVLVMLASTALFKAAALLRIRHLLGSGWRALLPWRSLATTGATAALAVAAATATRWILAGAAPATVLCGVGGVFVVVYATAVAGWWWARRRSAVRSPLGERAVSTAVR